LHFHDRIVWDASPELAAPIASAKAVDVPHWMPPPRRIWLVAVAVTLVFAVALQVFVHIVRQARSLRLRLRLTAAARDGDGARFRRILLAAHHAPPGTDPRELADTLPEPLQNFLQEDEQQRFSRFQS
jgi:hypothetical protein